MGSTVSFLIVVFGYLAFGLWAIIWISKKKKAGEKVSLWAKIIIAVVLLSSSSVLISMIEPAPAPETNIPEASATYYVKAKSANVRECPSTSCKVIDSLSQNTPLTFPGDLFDKYPDWAEVTFPNGEKGYISKTTLSENIVPESQLTPTDDSSSIGGITVGPWSNLQMTQGDSYELYFCEPPSAISGATCGALADTATDPRGGTPPYSFFKKSGFLPPGMTLELNGTLRGSPTQTGTYNFRLCAKDLYGGEGCQDLAVVVIDEKRTPLAPPSQSDTAPVTSPPEEQIPDYGHTVDSTTCSLSPSKNPYDTFFNKRVQANGTAWGPIGASVSLSAAGYEHICGSWTNVRPNSDSSYCKRGPGDPEKTNWALDESYSSDSKIFSVFVTSGCCELPTASYPAKEYPFKHTKILDQPCN